MTPTQELEHLRHVERVLRERVANLEAELRVAQTGYRVMWSLWTEEIRPGWAMWRVRRRREALERSTCGHRAQEIEGFYFAPCHLPPVHPDDPHLHHTTRIGMGHARIGSPS